MGCVIIWGVVPYNNFLFQNTYLSDSYLPEIVIGLLMVMVLLINPLLRLIGPGCVLGRRQLALIGSLLLLAAVIPSNGLMRMYPRFVAETNKGFNDNTATARIAAEAHLPQSLFPDPLPTLDAQGKVKTHDTPNSNQFIDELNPGNTLPWSAWMGPMALWGAFILALWMMMLGLAGVVFPQWRDRERLPFPLLNVYQMLTGNTDEPSDSTLPDLFHNRGFWIAALTVFAIHGLRGLNEFTHAFPSIPLSWDLSSYYTDSILRYAGGVFSKQHIFFTVIGVTYFIPNRYAISAWGWVVGVALYSAVGYVYIPAFNGDAQVSGISFGALFGIATWTLWLGREHWVKVGRAMLGQAGGDPESRRNRVAGWMFAMGCAGMICWLYCAGCALWWCLVATAGCAIISLLMARIIAETGVPFLWMSKFEVAGLLSLFPLAWQSPSTLYFDGVIYALVTRASAVSAAVMATLALGFDKNASPTHQSRLLVGGLVVMVVGLVICGAVHLNMGYHSDQVATAAKTSVARLNDWNRVEHTKYEFFTVAHGYQGLGLVLGIALLWACSRFVSWPIHPVGILFCYFSIGNLIWFSIFLGWLVKVSMTRLFGSGAYRRARPFLLGLIIGELAAVIFWAWVPVIIVLWTGADPAAVPRYSLIRYP